MAPALPQLTRLQRPQIVFVQQTNIDDAGMEFAGAITQLELLQLDDNPITDEGLQHCNIL